MNEDGEIIELTPKGFFASLIMEYGATYEQACDAWHRFEGFAMRMIKQHDEAAYAALVFDGEGGDVVGVNFDEIEEIEDSEQ